jgi:hypothetical protein
MGPAEMLFNPHLVLAGDKAGTWSAEIHNERFKEVLKTYNLYFTVSLAITRVVPTTFLPGASAALKDLLGDGNAAKYLRMPLHVFYVWASAVGLLGLSIIINQMSNKIENALQLTVERPTAQFKPFRVT